MKITLGLCFIWTLNNFYFRITSVQASLSSVILVNQGDRFDLVDLDKDGDYKSYKFIILACQADYETQNRLNESSSTKSTLIIKEIIKSPTNVRDYEICENEYSPTIIEVKNLDQDKMIGYEFYLDDQQVEQLSDILPEINVQSNESNEKNFIRITKNWFFYLIMDIHSRVVGTTHLVTAKEYTGYFKSCGDLGLGLSYINNEHIHELYVAENQITTLKQFLTDEKAENNYLIKQQLTPIDDFSSYSKRITTCTYLNMAPMWNAIADGSWKIIENKIREIAKTTPLEISTGTYGTLRLPLLSSRKHELRDVVLYDTAIPELFWKFVVDQRPIENHKHHYRGVLIFTFNYIDRRTMASHFCEKSVCEELNWKVDNHDYSTGYTYCCKPERHYLKKLNLVDEMISYRNFHLEDGDLHLHNMVHNSLNV